METLAYEKETKDQLKKEKKDSRSIPTITKNGELAIAYNIAYNRLSNFIKNLTNEPYDLRALFQERNKTNGLSSGIGFMSKRSLFEDSISEKSHSIYAELMFLLFKEKAKSTNTEFIDTYIPIVNLVLLKLWRFRDYHAHYHHSDLGLYFSAKQKEKLEYVFDIAIAHVQANYSQGTYKLFKEKAKFFKEVVADKKYKITVEGINIFLSLFLTKGEMTRFLKDRENCNRNDELKFKVKHEIYKYYCHRDSANVLRKALEKGDGFDENELMQAKTATLENYINSMPFFMYDKLNDEEKENQSTASLFDLWNEIFKSF